MGNEIFTGYDASNDPYTLETLEAIRTQVQTCEIGDLPCLAQLNITQIESALDAQFAAIANILLPSPPGYGSFSYENGADTFQFDIGTQTFTGEIRKDQRTSEIVDTYIRIPMTVFGAFSHGDVSDTTKALKTKYSYLGLRLAWDIYKPTIPLDIKMLLAIFFRGEMQEAIDARLEALARTFFDPQSGGCPNDKDCSYDNIVGVLNGSEFFYDRTDAVQGNEINYAEVRVDGTSPGSGLLVDAYIEDLEAAQANNKGPFLFDNYVSSIFSNHLDWLKFPGQNEDHASRWGNFTMLPDDYHTITDNKSPEEQFTAIQTQLQTTNNDSGIKLFDWEVVVTKADCIEIFVIVNTHGIAQGIFS